MVDFLLGEDHGTLFMCCGRLCFTLGLAGCRPHLKCQHLDFLHLLTPWPSCPRLSGAKG